MVESLTFENGAVGEMHRQRTGFALDVLDRRLHHPCACLVQHGSQRIRNGRRTVGADHHIVGIAVGDVGSEPGVRAVGQDGERQSVGLESVAERAVEDS